MNEFLKEQDPINPINKQIKENNKKIKEERNQKKEGGVEKHEKKDFKANGKEGFLKNKRARDTETNTKPVVAEKKKEKFAKNAKPSKEVKNVKKNISYDDDSDGDDDMNPYYAQIMQNLNKNK